MADSAEVVHLDNEDALVITDPQVRRLLELILLELILTREEL